MSISKTELDIIERALAEGRLDDAYAALAPLAEQYPGSMDVWHNLGIYHQKKGEHENAMQCFTKALEIHPQFENCLFNAAVSLYLMGKPADALMYLRVLLANNHRFHQALLNAGEIAFQLQQYRDAAEFYERYLWLFPHKRKDMLPNIAHCLQYAEQTRPDDVRVKRDLYTVLQELGIKEQAAEVRFRGVFVNPQAWVDEFPNDAEARGILIASKIKSCRWDGLERDIAALRRLIRETRQFTEPAFNLIGTTQEEQFINITRYANAKYPERKPYDKSARLPRRDGKLTIGYLSSDFHEHATAYLIAALFEHHDRARYRILAYSRGVDDHSPMRQRLKNGVDKFIDMATWPAQACANRIAEDGVDILVDLKGWCLGNCMDIAALRPAPIIVHYLGYPGTTGGMCDYIIADDMVIPEKNERWFSEKVIRLPCCYQVNDDKTEISDTLTRAEYGLPEKGKIFASFNQPYKIMPDVWRRWMGDIKNESGVLWQYTQNSESMENLRAEAEKCGVDPARIIPAQHVAHPEHLARFRIVDVFLDTSPVSGHTTMSDALRMEVPQIRFQHMKNTFIENVASSLLHHKKTLFDTAGTARCIEDAYERIAQLHNA